MIIGTEFISLLTVSLLSNGPTEPDRYGGTYTSNKCESGGYSRTNASTLLEQMQDQVLTIAETEAEVQANLDHQMEIWNKEYNIQSVEDDINLAAFLIPTNR